MQKKLKKPFFQLYGEMKTLVGEDDKKQKNWREHGLRYGEEERCSHTGAGKGKETL